MEWLCRPPPGHPVIALSRRTRRDTDEDIAMRVFRRVRHTDGISEISVRGGEVRIVLSDSAANSECKQDRSCPRRAASPGPAHAIQDCVSSAGHRSAAKVSRDKARSTDFRERKRRHGLLERFRRILRLAARMLRMARICLQHMQERGHLSAKAVWQNHHGDRKRPGELAAASCLEELGPPLSTCPPGLAPEFLQAGRKACSPSPLELLLFPVDTGSPSLYRMWGCGPMSPLTPP